MSDIFREIKISDIDLSDERYQISESRTDIAFLALSIFEFGLVNSVVLLPCQGITLCKSITCQQQKIKSGKQEFPYFSW